LLLGKRIGIIIDYGNVVQLFITDLSIVHCPILCPFGGAYFLRT